VRIRVTALSRTVRLRRDRQIHWPEFAAAVIVAVALFSALGQVSTVARTGWAWFTAHTNPAGLRELAPASSHGVSTQALELAAKTIPPDARYAIVVGQEPPFDPSVANAVPSIVQYWLLPRRYTLYVKDASWIVTYHAPSETLGVKVAQEIGLGPDANLIRVDR
jgi:hypothetical protein